MTYDNSAKKHRVVGSFTTNTSVPGHESWDLRPYKTAGIGKAGGTWRLIEVGYNLAGWTRKRKTNWRRCGITQFFCKNNS